MPTRPDDARAHRSVDALRRAFVDLLETRPLEQISNKDITEGAGLSYPTFFRRFSGKEELLEDIARAEIRKLLSIGDGVPRRNAVATIRDMCIYIRAHRRLWKTLLTSDASSAMRKEFSVLADRIGEARQVHSWIPTDLAKAFVVSGIFEIFAWWVNQPDDYPVENVVTLFDALILDVVRSHRDISLL
jgi:AcrR family transcriptional regulator